MIHDAKLPLVAAPDKSNGYEKIASIYIAGRGQNVTGIGAAVVAEWSKVLPTGATILDLGCGTGVPITKTLIERGLNVYGVDASPSMIAAFRARFPEIPVQCAAVEDSEFFQRSFDAVVAWGLFFLLDADTQRRLIKKIAAVLPSGGRLLFTAPEQSCTWTDVMTDLPSISLGHDEYRNALESEGLLLYGSLLDAGENYYYLAQKR
jgi:SAM-dependent methyltransferase